MIPRIPYTLYPIASVIVTIQRQHFNHKYNRDRAKIILITIMQQILSKRKRNSLHRLGISKYWPINNGQSISNI